MLGAAFEYPRRGENWLMRTIIGGVLVFVGAFILIPLIVVEGYVYRVLGRTSRGEQYPPEWEEWVDLFVEGIQMYIIQIAYFVIPGFLLVMGILVTVFGVFAEEAATTVGVALLVIGGVLQLIAIYLLPAALTNFAYTERLGAAFDFGTILDVASTAEYFVTIVLAIVVGVVVGLIGSLLSAILVGFFILFYLQVAIAYLFARGFINAGGVAEFS